MDTDIDLEMVAENLALNYHLGFAYGQEQIDASAYGLGDLAREFRTAATAAESCTMIECAEFHRGTAIAFGIALANLVDDGALSDLDIERLAQMKARIARGEITDAPPAA